MFKNLKGDAGWCDFELGGAKGRGSWNGDGALDFVEAFIDRLQDKSRLNVELDGEGTRTALVETTTRTFVLQWPDPVEGTPLHRRPKMYDITERSLRDLTFELLRDVEPELEGWAMFLRHGNAKAHDIAAFARRVAHLRELAEHRWRWGETARDAEWYDSILGNRFGWEFFGGRANNPRRQFKGNQNPAFPPEGVQWPDAADFLRALPPLRRLRPALRPVKKTLNKWYRAFAAAHPSLKGTRLAFTHRARPAYEAPDGTLYLRDSIRKNLDGDRLDCCDILLQIPPQGGIASFATVDGR